MADVRFNYMRRNAARRLHQMGCTPEEINARTRVPVHMIETYIATLQPSEDSDRFGPLPGSPEWDELSPGARSGLTRKRQNAERAQDADHSTV